MKISNFKKLIIVSFSLFILANCSQEGEEEVKEYVRTVTWSGLNLEVKIRTKYFDNNINIIAYVKDIDNVPLQETDYYKKFSKRALVLGFFDKDSFVLFEEIIKVNRFYNSWKDGKPFSLAIQTSRSIDKLTYLEIVDVIAGTR